MKRRFKFKFLEDLGKAFVPERIRPHLRNYLLKAGIVEVNYRFFGALFFFDFLITLFLYIRYVYSFLSGKSPLYMGLGTFAAWFVVMLGIAVVFMLCIYFFLDLRIYKRTKQIEDILPEFLQFVSSNLKGGMSFDRALWMAIKPRFGVLATEIEIVAKKVMTGEDVDEAMKEFTKMYDSPVLRRSFDLIIEGMKGGGKIVDMIDKVIDNINEAVTLKKELTAAVMSYTIFITVIVILVAPGLFGLSYQLLIIVSSFASRLGAAGTGSSALPISFSSLAIKPEDFEIFSMLAVGIISVFSAMIISIISRGDIKGGIKYIPVFLAVSLVNYQIALAALTSAFAFLI